MAHAILETLATGDEVVNGDVIDSNSAYVSQALTNLGHLIARHTALPDDSEVLVRGIQEISARADLCICSGGLGPTEDDLTAEVVAKVMGVKVAVHDETVTRMKERFAKMGMRFSENNLRSARYPEGATVKLNEVGTAPAFSMKIGRCQFFFLPGVPREFYFFVEAMVLPWIQMNMPDGFGAVVQLKTMGIPESHLAEKFADFGQVFPKIKVGYRAHTHEVWLKLTAEAASKVIAEAELAPAVQEAEKRLGLSIFGRNREELDQIVHEELTRRGLKLATAESCTGGAIAQLLTQHAGSSAYYLGGAVTYSNELKASILRVPEEILRGQGAVSHECAQAMAENARKEWNADLAIAVTGIAGPTGATPTKPVGLVYFCLATRAGAPILLERNFRGGRERVQRAAAYTALEMLRRQLLGISPLSDGAG